MYALTIAFAGCFMQWIGIAITSHGAIHQEKPKFLQCWPYLTKGNLFPRQLTMGVKSRLVQQ